MLQSVLEIGFLGFFRNMHVMSVVFVVVIIISACTNFFMVYACYISACTNFFMVYTGTLLLVDRPLQNNYYYVSGNFWYIL